VNFEMIALWKMNNPADISVQKSPNGASYRLEQSRQRLARQKKTAGQD